MKYWNKNFPKLNSNELFTNVDKDDSDDIQIEEWIEFWKRVLATHKAEDLSEDVNLNKITFLVR